MATSCAELRLRAAMPTFINDPIWLISSDVFDGVASGVIGVAVPVLGRTLPWGSARRQTAPGTVHAVQGVGGAFSAWNGGLTEPLCGWT